ncbi:uncharacterized protein LOC122006984 isoform X2 [Zingiber officinale]|uniref:uncharacterized protein LOC122006984 isoform X2 n=1 Tax=Zingiber officinale TaxID=94328 RepID=UPI001C4B647B|nr:uncharacterized protein LOC122006984 isoform X2 [Zingiber officinale]
MPPLAMSKKGCIRRELLDRWNAIQEEEDNSLPSSERRVLRVKEEWFSDSFNFLVNLPEEKHIWCDFSDLMVPLLETFHNYFKDANCDSPLKILWKRVSRELGHCTQCICQHHHAQEYYNVEYETDSVDPLLTVLQCLDEERVTEHLRNINAKIRCKEYNPESQGAEIVGVMFEVLMFPLLLDDQLLANEFQFFIEAVDESHEVTLSSNQQYPGIYALLFLKSGRARAVGFRLAGCMGKLRRAADLESIQTLLRKYIGFLEADVLPSVSDMLRPRVQHERINVWNGFKTLLGFLEAEALEDGILEKYPIFLSIVLNHVSDDTAEFSFAVACLRTLFEMLGCKLWLRTTLSPSMMRNTLLGQCFHTRNEKSHKEIFDLFLPFLQSLESLQDGEYEKQRRHFLYFLLHQVTQSKNFSNLMRKNSCKISLLIVHRGYMLNPPCPPSECAHMWGPSLVNSLMDSSLHSSLRQPAFDLINTIIVSDASALVSLKLKNRTSTCQSSTHQVFVVDEDEQLFSHDVEEKDDNCWSEFSTQNKLTSFECTEWACIPMLWFEVLIKIEPSMLPISFSKAVFWALSHISLLEFASMMELSSSIEEWLSVNAREISSSFGWEIPTGTDDGGDGKECRNSVRASSRTLVLTKTLKRFAAHFVLQVERHELHKQWTWMPKMAESLILLIINPDDGIRQVDRVILEHVSRTRGLTSGLQFLCSSATSMSAIFSGLRFVLQQVLTDSLVENFHNLHHLFFIIRKLLKEVVTTNLISFKEDFKSENHAFHGGFLHQPCFEDLPDTSDGNSGTIVDMKSWEKFCCSLSAVVWPSIVKCLKNGKELINSKSCQMTSVRLLEALPAVFESLSFSSPELSGNLACLTYDILDPKWLYDLVEWGRSSLIVVSRHWKQCTLTLLNHLKNSRALRISCNLDVIQEIMLQATVPIDNLKERVRQLKISLTQEASENKVQREMLLFSEPFREKQTVPKTCLYDDHVSAGVTLPQSAKNENVIVLSDDEIEETVSPDFIGIGNSSDHHKQTDTTLPSDNLQNFSSKISPTNTQLSSHNIPLNDVFSGNMVSSELSTSASTPLIPLKNLGADKEITKSSNTSEDISSVRKDKSVSQAKMPSVKKISLLEEKDAAAIKELIREDDDILEHALNRPTHSKLFPTKQSISVPRRQVVPLQLPTKNKVGFLNRKESGIRRLKPPKLDDWYRPILELDYFSLVGLTSGIDDGKSSTRLKKVPLCFESSSHYVQIFRPLVLEEFKAQLHNARLETSTEDMCCNNLSIVSVERVDDFHLIRGCLDSTQSVASRMCTENDLVLLTKEPLQNCAQNVHVLGKVERREKNDKSYSIVLVIRLYLPNGSSRFNNVRRLLIERSKWFLSRLMSITPQLREFQALSSLNDIPVLPIILNPLNHAAGYLGSKKFLEKLSHSLQKILISSYNDSQLQAISFAIGSSESKENFEFSLIQGPPGTGKTKTIVAIVSAWLALPKNYCSRISSMRSVSTSNESHQKKTPISQSAAVAKAWQDAAFAKQLINNAENDSSAPTERSPRGRILVCAQSNAAVDELVSRISEGLYGNDGKAYRPYLVRVGNLKTVHPSSLPFFIDTLVDRQLAEEMNNQTGGKNDNIVEASSSLRAKLEKIVDNIRYYESKRAKIEENELNTNDLNVDKSLKKIDSLEMSDAAIGAKLNMLYGQKKAICADLTAAHAREKKVSEESWSLKRKIRKSILKEAEIVVTTLSGCGGDIYGVCSESASNNRFGVHSEHNLFDAVIIDEAAQALEPATLIPLQLLKSKGTKCIMVGDPKQLPATVFSDVASKFLYECSMFERLQRAGHPVIMLNEQHRMHPEICRFPSMHFYESKLLNGAKVADRSALFHENNYLSPYMFFDIADGHEHHGKNSSSVSLFNEAEAEAAVDILKFLNKRYPFEFTSRRIGVVTPYRSQLSLLRSRFSSVFGAEQISDMEFNTVDGFQGREVDILVLSTVRASGSSAETPKSSSNGIGFVADVRRMNVALTRAKFSLWVVGNARTLQTNVNWAAMIENSKERNLFISVTRPYSSIFTKAVSSSHKSNHSKLDLDSRHHNKTERGKNAERGNKFVRFRTKTGDKLKHNMSTNNEPSRGTVHSSSSNSIGPHKLGSSSLLSPVQAYEYPKNIVSREASRSERKPVKQCEDSADFENSAKTARRVSEIPRCNTPSQNSVSLASNESSQVQGSTHIADPGSLMIKPKTARRFSETPRCNTSSPDAVSLASNESSQGQGRRKKADPGSLMKKAKTARRFSENPRCNTSSQSSSCPASNGSSPGSSKISDSKPCVVQEPKDLIARRKRQRADVEALLSSALISSKKPGASSKPTSPVENSYSNTTRKRITKSDIV